MKTLAKKTAELLALFVMFSAAASVAQAHGHGGGGGMSHQSFSQPSRMSSAVRYTQSVQKTTLPAGGLFGSNPTTTGIHLPTGVKNPAGGLFGSNPTTTGTTGIHLPTGVNKQPAGGLFGSNPTNPVHLPPYKLPTGTLKPVGGLFGGSTPTNPIHLPPYKLPTGTLKPIGGLGGSNPTTPTNPTSPTNPTNPTAPPTGNYGGGFGFPIFGFGGFGGGYGGGYSGVSSSGYASGYADSPAPVAAMPTAVAASSAPDLQVVAVDALDAGDAADLIGPRYRVTVRNASNVDVNTEFSVSLMASGGQQAGAAAQGNARKVSGLAAGQTTQVDIRLPYGVDKLAASSQGHAASLYLIATADSNNEVNDANRGNNTAAVVQEAAPTRVASAQ